MKAEELGEALEISRMVTTAEDAGHVPGPAIAVSLQALRSRYSWIKTCEAVSNAQGFEIEATTYLFAGAALVPLDDVREPPRRLNYIEGAIELSIDGHPIITKDEWDLVDQVWAYLVNVVQRVAAGHDAQMPFPDTPIDVTFALDAASETVTVTLSYKTLPAPRRATAPRAELVRRICELARGVFEKLYALVPDARFQRVLDQIREVLSG